MLRETSEQTWGQWCKTNILGAVPIAGPFFAKGPMPPASERAEGQASVLAGGGTLVMLLHLMNNSGEQNPAVLFFILAGKMALGMGAGLATYNSLRSCGEWADLFSPSTTRTSETEERLLDSELNSPS